MLIARRAGFIPAGVVALMVMVLMMLAAALFISTPARAQSGQTVAPDLVSVGNFRPDPNSSGTFVDFTFDQQVFLTGGDRTSFGLVPVDGGDSVSGSGSVPPEQVDPTGDNTITVLFNGQVSPADFARGFVSNDTVSSGAQGNESPNIEQAEDIAPSTTSVNPDLVSVRLDCQQQQAFFTFDEPLDQEDVVQNTGGLQIYFSDTTRASAQVVEQTGDPAVLRAEFTDLPQGRTLNDAVGSIVTTGTVAGQPPSGPGGQAINQLDEVGQLQRGSSCGADGGDSGGGGAPGDGAPGDGGNVGDQYGGNGGGGTGGGVPGEDGETPGDTGGGVTPDGGAGGSGSGGQNQEVNQSNEQTGTVTGGGSVVNNASNVAQQCQTGSQVVDGNGNVVISSAQCSQIVNQVQAGESAEQAVSQVVEQDQSVTGVQYGDEEAPALEAQDAGTAPVDEAPVDEAPADETVAEDGADEVAPEGSADKAVSDQDGEAAVPGSGDDEAAAGDSAGGTVADDAESVEPTDELTVLPDTGGSPLLTLLAGAMLVTGGLTVRRIVG